MAKFKTSARTVDMLGRQQIAGIPTAMSELFKNAYDAYAKEVRADYFPEKSLLALRDDGIGMSEGDFIDRWLTLGTDSKTSESTLAPISRPKGSKRRPLMGEKGIGRLAIASISPLVMIVSRANTSNIPSAEVTAALVPWTLFETPGLTLDEIDIPVISRTVAEVDYEALLGELVAILLQSVQGIRDRLGAPRTKQIRSLTQAALNTRISQVRDLDGPQLHAGSGTTFLLFGTGDDLVAAVSTGDGEEQVPEFQRFIGGFSNTITRSPEETPIRTRFVVHGTDGTADDLISPESFWRQSDFDSVDHVISGEFDTEGTFTGTVQIYRGDSIPYTLGWGNPGREPKCGAFRFTLGVLQGDPKESRLPADEFVLMTRRLRAQGGLYIYRDDIRVLPYGNSDVDYLGIEERRTLNAGRYYFSHRRIFGAVELSAIRNPGLQEKAGREGFRQNAPYRDFVAMLEHFLRQIANDFFRQGGDHHDEFDARRGLLAARTQARADRERRERQSRDRFAARIDEVTQDIQSGAFENELAKLRVTYSPSLAEASKQPMQTTFFSELLTNLRRDEVRLTKRIALRRPVALALTAGQERSFESATHLTQGALELLGETVDRLSADILKMAEEHDESASVEPSTQQYFLAYSSESVAEALQEVGETRDLIHQASRQLLEELSRVVEELSSGAESITNSAQHWQYSSERMREKERAIDALVDTVRVRVEKTRGTVESIMGDPAALLDNRHLQERVLDLEDEADSNVELMQLGLAVQLVNHEFENNIAAVRSGLRRLQPWARANPRLNAIVQDVRNAFQHLDGYLRMFTPLQRRLYRRRVAFTGADLISYCRGVFEERLGRHDISLETTLEFEQFELFGFPSSFYPVFLNLIDNAIHWTQQRPGRRTIRLDAKSGQLLVSDSGPGILPQDSAAVFERGFSRRRGGRGLGLALAAETLAREGWVLEVGPRSGPLGGAVFVISKGDDRDG